MATVADALTGETTPISLYIDLVPSTRADIEVVSRAAIAWSELIREAVFLVEPFAEVRVELMTGTEGSLNLNARINAIRGVISDPKKLKAVAYAILLFFGGQFSGWVIGKGFDVAWESLSAEAAQVWDTLSSSEQEEALRVARQVVESKTAREKAQRVYAELSKDDRVTGVGATLTPGHRPADIVPRSEFSERAGGSKEIVEETIQRRIVPDRLTLTLIAPSLSEEDYKWKFRLGTKTVWAHMDDETMRARIAPGSNSAPRMLLGIVLDVDLETIQEFRDNVWVVIDQRVTKVHSLKEPTSQPSWLNSPRDDDEAHHNGR